MTGDHYFSASPASAQKLRTIEVVLAGREVEVVTAGGVFSGERVDPGTAVLLANTPPPPVTGDILDLGCGWGPITLACALQSPQATVWAVDVNERALDLVRKNARALGLERVNALRPEDVPAHVRFDSIRSNPPIRVGKSVLHEMMRTWLPRLHEHGDAWLVVQRNLGSDSLQRWLAAEFDGHLSVGRATTSRGYRVLRLRRHADGSESAVPGLPG